MPDTTTKGADLFAAFLEAHGITLIAAAEALRVSDPTILDWRRGRKRPGAHHRLAIETWTSGRVPADAWLTAEERASLNVRPFSSREA